MSRQPAEEESVMVAGVDGARFVRATCPDDQAVWQDDFIRSIDGSEAIIIRELNLAHFEGGQ